MQQMLNNLRARREDERGFTLIELMVVVLIIAILIAIAIPTFLGAKTRAQDKAAQSSLRNALTNAKGIYTDTDLYPATATLVSQLIAAEPSITFQAGASTGPKSVSVVTVDDDHVMFVSQADSTNCFVIGDAANGPGTVFAKLSGACSGANAVAQLTTPSTATQASTGAGDDAWSSAF
jgi:type IV pilus assembly protein PilA